MATTPSHRADGHPYGPFGTLEFIEAMHGWALDIGEIVATIYCNVINYDDKSEVVLSNAKSMFNAIHSARATTDAIVATMAIPLENLENLDIARNSKHQLFQDVLDTFSTRGMWPQHAFAYIGFAGGVFGYAATRRRGKCAYESLHALAVEQLAKIAQLYRDFNIQPRTILTELNRAVKSHVQGRKLDIREVARQQAKPLMQQQSQPVVILMVSLGSHRSEEEKFAEEARLLTWVKIACTSNHQYEMVRLTNPRPPELSETISQLQPVIVHFSSDGTTSEHCTLTPEGISMETLRPLLEATKVAERLFVVHSASCPIEKSREIGIAASCDAEGDDEFEGNAVVVFLRAFKEAERQGWRMEKECTAALAGC